MVVGTFLAPVAPRHPLSRITPLDGAAGHRHPQPLQVRPHRQAAIQRLGWPAAVGVGFMKLASSVIVVSHNTGLDTG